MYFDNAEDRDADSRTQPSWFSDLTGYTENNSGDLDAFYASIQRKFMEKNYIVDRTTPHRQELCARYKRSMAFHNFTERLPNLLMEMVKFFVNDESRLIEERGEYVHFDLKRINWSLEIMHKELVENRQLALFHGKAPDTDAWNEFLLDLKEEKNQWLSAVWLYAECYLYRRLWAIFNRSCTLKDYDYFSQHKIPAAMDFQNLMHSTRVATQGLERSKKNLQLMLKLSLWASRSLNPYEESILTKISDYKKNLLVDDSALCWDILTKFPLEPTYVDIICNNAGFEIFSDLLLADYIIESGLASRVRFHVKAIPWFISDAMPSDIHWMLQFLIKNESHQLSQFGRRLKCLLRNRSIILCQKSEFWTSPREFSTMKKLCPCLYVTLSEGTLAIFKGDLNYRKLLGDINYESTTPFKDCLKGFLPTSICALRTIKSDIYCGLPICTVEWLNEENPNWMKTGEKGVIHVAVKSRP